jgi:hypothetical protein
MKPFEDVTEREEEQPTYRCPCCGYLTLCGRGQDEICRVCFLARHNFREFGASDRRCLDHLRKPTPEET